MNVLQQINIKTCKASSAVFEVSEALSITSISVHKGSVAGLTICILFEIHYKSFLKNIFIF